MKPLSDTYVEETRFGFWFLRSHTWQHLVLRVAINDLRSLFSDPLPAAPVLLDAGCGQGAPFAGCQRGGQRAARPEPERIARNQRRHRPPAQAKQRGKVKGHRPFPCPRTARQSGKCQMTRATKDDFRRLQRFAACRRQAAEAIFTQTDDAKPGISHDAHPSFGGHE